MKHAYNQNCWKPSIMLFIDLSTDLKVAIRIGLSVGKPLVSDVEWKSQY